MWKWLGRKRFVINDRFSIQYEGRIGLLRLSLYFLFIDNIKHISHSWLFISPVNILLIQTLRYTRAGNTARYSRNGLAFFGQGKSEHAVLCTIVSFISIISGNDDCIGAIDSCPRVTKIESWGNWARLHRIANRNA